MTDTDTPYAGPTDSELIGWCPACQMPYSAPACCPQHALFAEVKARPERLLQVLAGQSELLARMGPLLEQALPPEPSPLSHGPQDWSQVRGQWAVDRSRALSEWHTSQETPEEALTLEERLAVLRQELEAAVRAFGERSDTILPRDRLLLEVAAEAWGYTDD